MNGTNYSNAMKYIKLMIWAIHDDSGEYVKEFDRKRPIISEMNKIVQGVIDDCQRGKIKLPYKSAVILERFTLLYQDACRASELYHHKQKMDANLVFIKGRVTPVPHRKDHYS